VLRRLAVSSLPILAAAAVLAVVIGSQGVRPRPAPVAAHAAARPAHAATEPARRVAGDVHGRAAERMPIPILEYHVIGTPRPGTPNEALWVTPSLFAAQMALLRHDGYHAIALAQAWRGWTKGDALPRRPVVVSFDDGYPGDYTHALPVLRRLGWAGVLNLELDNVGAHNLSSHQVRSLIAAGWEIDSHTVDHPDLTTLGASRLDYELRASRQMLRQRFGVPALFFCYPFGRYDARVQAAVKAAGYLAATTENEGYATAADPYALKRVRVMGAESAATLLARLRSERPAV
jgi:peptidoglycan/xylan/chitin deacetylase (PgdA/CDA1 family)